MKLTKKMCRVIADLEYLIGSECFNKNSYDGWRDISGCSFRYPVNVPDKNMEYYIKVRYNNINSSYKFDSRDIDDNTIKYMKYCFGSNELYIGNGIINVLEYLEERYNIDFWELEQKIK